MSKSELLQSVYIPEGKSRTDKFYGDYWLMYDEGELVAIGHIRAPKRGDEIMLVLSQTLQSLSNTYKRPIRHDFFAGNKGADALARRTKGYEYSHDDEKGRPVYVRKYLPK